MLPVPLQVRVRGRRGPALRKLVLHESLRAAPGRARRHRGGRLRRFFQRRGQGWRGFYWGKRHAAGRVAVATLVFRAPLLRLAAVIAHACVFRCRVQTVVVSGGGWLVWCGAHGLNRARTCLGHVHTRPRSEAAVVAGQVESFLVCASVVDYIPGASKGRVHERPRLGGGGHCESRGTRHGAP
jgi:hypothetical protein